MTRQFRNALYATTIIAGIALGAAGSAGAGPNGPSFSPSLGSISSMRMDFSMRAPNALRDRDIVNPRTVELPRKKEDAKPLPGRPSKKGTDVASRGKPGAGAAGANISGHAPAPGTHKDPVNLPKDLDGIVDFAEAMRITDFLESVRTGEGAVAAAAGLLAGFGDDPNDGGFDPKTGGLGRRLGSPDDSDTSEKDRFLSGEWGARSATSRAGFTDKSGHQRAG